jgi:hypothetical protein
MVGLTHSHRESAGQVKNGGADISSGRISGRAVPLRRQYGIGRRVSSVDDCMVVKAADSALKCRLRAVRKRGIELGDLSLSCYASLWIERPLAVIIGTLPS